MSQLRFETVTSRIQVQSTTYRPTCSVHFNIILCFISSAYIIAWFEVIIQSKLQIYIYNFLPPFMLYIQSIIIYVICSSYSKEPSRVQNKSSEQFDVTIIFRELYSEGIRFESQIGFCHHRIYRGFPEFQENFRMSFLNGTRCIFRDRYLLMHEYSCTLLGTLISGNLIMKKNINLRPLSITELFRSSQESIQGVS